VIDSSQVIGFEPGGELDTFGAYASPTDAELGLEAPRTPARDAHPGHTRHLRLNLRRLLLRRSG